MSQTVQQYVDNGDGTRTPVTIKVLTRAGQPEAPTALVQPAPVPVVEVAHVQTRPVAEAEPVAEAADVAN